MPHTEEFVLYYTIYIKFKTPAKPICDLRVKTLVAWAGSRVDGMSESHSIFYSGFWFLGHKLCENSSMCTLDLQVYKPCLLYLYKKLT